MLEEEVSLKIRISTPIFLTVFTFLAFQMVLAQTSRSEKDEYYRSSIDREISLEGIGEGTILAVDSTNKSFRIFVNFDSYILSVKKAIDATNIPGPKERKERLLSYLKSLRVVDNQVTISFEDILRERLAIDFLHYLGNLIEKGQCRIIDKSTNKQIMKLGVGEWSNAHGLTGGGGRLFRTLDGKDVLATSEWIS